MEVLYLLIPLAVVLAGVVVWAFFWSVKSGQFDDLEGPAHRILLDDAKPQYRDVAPSARGEHSFGNGRKAAGMNDVTLGAMPPSPKELRHGSRQLLPAVPRDAKSPDSPDKSSNDD
jgi:cbb3-type cytochrome oxidase maturation protein